MTIKTRAGARLLGWLRVVDAGGLPPPIDTASAAIAAIEAEAVDLVFTELAASLRAGRDFDAAVEHVKQVMDDPEAARRAAADLRKLADE